jgi:hypothetical protein
MQQKAVSRGVGNGPGSGSPIIQPQCPARCAETVDHVLDQFRIDPRPERRADDLDDARLQLEQLLHRLACLVTLAKLSLSWRERHVRRAEAGHIDFERINQCTIVVTFAG